MKHTRDTYARWQQAVDTARDTGRLIFGQLWWPDPTFDEVLRFTYVDWIGDTLNRPSPLYAMLKART